MTSLFQQEKTTPWQKQGREDKCVSDDWRDADGDNCVCPALPAIVMLGGWSVCKRWWLYNTFLAPCVCSSEHALTCSSRQALARHQPPQWNLTECYRVSRVAWQCCRLHYNIPHTVGRMVIVGFVQWRGDPWVSPSCNCLFWEKTVEYCFSMMRERESKRDAKTFFTAVEW